MHRLSERQKTLFHTARRHYAFLEDAVARPSVTGYFTGNGTAPSSDTLDALLHEAIDQSGILLLCLRIPLGKPPGWPSASGDGKIHLRQHRRPYGTAATATTGHSTYCKRKR
ncbi:MAG: hypothetical protein ACLUBZ_17215 [Ruthenibacterium lactatiformans]|uniref:hypothetical protein n=1 Tax=Ruthenibacterium lactatiformans TaxID=1550024 RepID=UPI003993C48A